jgi:O-antigen/teichoic acid export membrane protein
MSEGVSRLLGFFTTIYLARTLDVHRFGIVNIGLSVFAYALLFSSQWLNLYGTRKVASGSGLNFVKNFLSLRLAFSVAVALFSGLLSITLIKDNQVALVVALFCLAVVPNAINLDWYFQGKEDLFPVAASRTILSLGYFLFLLLFLYLNKGVASVPVAFLVGNIFAISFLWLCFIKGVAVTNLGEAVKNKFQIFREAFSLSFASVLSQINLNIPLIVISIFLSASEAGIFSAASKLVFFLLIADRVFYSIYFPTVSRIHSRTPKQVEEVISFVFRISLLIILPVAVCGTFFAKDLIEIIYGTNYFAAVSVFKILIWYFCITIMNSVLGYALIAIEKEKDYSKIIITSTPVFLIIISFSTLYYGVSGTAISIVAYELFLLTFFKYYLRKNIRLNLFTYILKIFLALAILLAILILLGHSVLSLVIGIICFFITAIVMKIISNCDIMTLKEKLIWN